MELKVWVDGIQRVICGVSESTTCQDIVLALAHATGRTGRFTLIEKWRSNERPLAPVEQPLQVLQKWGEYATDVQFMLIQTDKDGLKSPSKTKLPSQGKKDRFSHNFTPPQQGDTSIKRSFTFSGAHSGNSVTSPARKRERFRDGFHESSISEESEMGSSSQTSPLSSSSKPVLTSRSTNHKPAGASISSSHKLESHSPYNSLERNKRRKSPHRSTPVGPVSSSAAQAVRSNYKPIPKPRGKTAASTANGPRSLDTYLSQNSPPDFQEARSSSPLPEFEEYDLDKNFPNASPQARGGRNLPTQPPKTDSTSSSDESQEYSSLVRLVALQQERLQVQESQISMIETEIKLLEEKGKADEERLQELEVEIHTWEDKHGDYEQELIEIDAVRWHDHLETEKMTENHLKSHIESLKTKLSTCEKELTDMTDKRESIMKEIEAVKIEISDKEKKDKEGELRLVQEVADVQKQINVKLVQHEEEQSKMEELTKEVKELETTILEKKMQIADLENSLREANLQQFVITPPGTPTSTRRQEEGESALFKQLSRPPGTRKHAVSPQDFSSLVNNSEHPDGVWV